MSLEDSKIFNKPMMFIGYDGGEYATYEEQVDANRRWNTKMSLYIGRDGRDYATYRELVDANRRYQKK